MFRLAITAALSALALGQDLTADNGFLDANVGIGADSKLSGSSPPPPSPPPTASTHTDSCHAEVRKKSENDGRTQRPLPHVFVDGGVTGWVIS